MSRILGIYIALFGIFPMYGISQCANVQNVAITDVICNGGNNGSIGITVSGNYNYIWSHNSSLNQPFVSGLTAGIYYVTISDPISGCLSVQSATVYEPDPITATESIIHVDCNGDNSGEVTILAAGGNGGFDYEWSIDGINFSNVTSNIVGSLYAGQYWYKVRDANQSSCNITKSLIVNETASKVDFYSSQVEVSCFGGSDAMVDIQTFGGTPPYVFDWSSNNNTVSISEDLNNVPLGTYTFLVTDALGCEKTSPFYITQPTLLSNTIFGFPVDCFGNNTGSVDLTPSGGTAPYFYNWESTNAVLGVSQDLLNVPADNYFVTITDSKGCERIDSAIVSQPNELLVSINKVNVDCYGNSTGSIDLTVTGGTLPYNFQWANSQVALPLLTTEDIQNIPSEYYTVTVTDGNNCTNISTIFISQPLAPLSATYTVLDVKCFGENTGEVEVVTVGGTPPYTFNWNQNATTEDIIDLFAGTYTILITDANGCNETYSMPVNQPAAPLSLSEVITEVKCYGENTGAIDLSTTGGTTPYTYSWTDSQFKLSYQSPDLFNIQSETYYLTITDSNSCILLDSFDVNQPDSLMANLSAIDVLCFGESTGQVNSNVTGGVTPYQFVWSTGAVTPNIFNVPSGNYLVTLTDQNLCETLDSIYVDQPDTSIYLEADVTNVTCPNGNDGKIFINFFGGTPDYKLAWSTGDTTSIVNNLYAGDYIIQITDNNNCILIDTLEVTDPDIIDENANVIDVTCFGYDNGVIDLNISGGTPGYRYQWSDTTYVISEFDPIAQNLPPNIYSVTVSDTNNCLAIFDFEINEPEPLEHNAIVTDVTCFGDTNGSVELYPTGGVQPYSYSWSNGQNVAQIYNLKPGFYSLVLRDSNQCENKDIFEIVEPDPIYLLADISEVSCKDNIDGIIDLDPQGGFGGFTYEWSNGTQENPAIELAGGIYLVTVTDILGCQMDSSLEVPVNPKRCLEIPNVFSPNADGINDVWEIENAFLFDDLETKVFNEWGEVVHSASGNTAWDGRYKGTLLPTGTYYYVITVNQGAEPYTGSITILR